MTKRKKTPDYRVSGPGVFTLKPDRKRLRLKLRPRSKRDQAFVYVEARIQGFRERLDGFEKTLDTREAVLSKGAEKVMTTLFERTTDLERRVKKLEAQQPPSSGIPVSAHDAMWSFFKATEKVYALADSLGVDVVVNARKAKS